MLKAALSASANSSLGLSEEVAGWTDGSELLVLVQHFNSITFLHERNLQIIPALISWQKVLVIFGSTCLEGVTDDLFYHFRACATLQLRVLGLELSPCPRVWSQGWTEQAWPQLGETQPLLPVCAPSVNISPSKVD